MLKKANESNANNIERNRNWNKELTVGAVLEGVYIQSEEFEGNFGPSIKYTIEASGTKEHVDVYATASLKRQFAKIPTGSFVRITYKGEQPSKKTGFNVKIFEVEYDDEYTA